MLVILKYSNRISLLSKIDLNGNWFLKNSYNGF